MGANSLYIAIGIVVGCVSTLVIDRVRLKPSNVLWCLCGTSLVLGVVTGFHAVLAENSGHSSANPVALEMWGAVSLLALSGILATVATKLQQAGH